MGYVHVEYMVPVLMALKCLLNLKVLLHDNMEVNASNTESFLKSSDHTNKKSVIVHGDGY